MEEYLGDPTGVIHNKRCGGVILYNGVYFCGRCSQGVEMTPRMYTGLFDYRYPKGNFEDHPNFKRKLYERGKAVSS